MAIQVEIHPAAKRAVFVVGFAVALGGTFIGLRKLTEAEPAPERLAAEPLRVPLAPTSALVHSNVGVWFSPNGGVTDACIREIDAAKQTIHVQAYGFTSPPIIRALVAAKKRGVDVQIILDKSQQSLPADLVAEVGIPTFIDASHAIAHNKVVIVDAAVVLTGSFNFSKAAEESNAENFLVIRDALLAGRYLENWRHHREHSVKHDRR